MTEEELIQLLVLENASELSKILEDPSYWGIDVEQHRQVRGTRILEILRQTACSRQLQTGRTTSASDG